MTEHHAAPSGPTEQRLLTGWGRSRPTRATVLRPAGAEDAARLLRAALDGGGPLVARGLGRSYCDAAQSAGGTVLEMTSARRILEFDAKAGTVTADAGLSIDELLRLSVPSGWFVPVTPGTRYVTLGGALAADVHGKNHHVDGSFGRFVSDAVLAAPAGVRHLSPRDGADELWASAGGMGLTGVFLQMTLQMLRIETSAILVDTERCSDLEDCMARMSTQDADYRYSVAWLDCLARGRHLGRGVLTRGNHARQEDVEAAGGRRGRDWREHRLALAPRQAGRVPVTPPLRLLSRASVRAFNEAWFRKAPARRRRELQSIPAFFHPLDGVGEWNRLYGPLGFTQYQFVVPFGEEDALRRVVEQLSSRQVPSFLSVLKRFGDAGSGHLSFPAPGWTLAVDIPLGLPGLGELLDRFDAIVVAAGGRVYLAKDGRVRPELIHSMYPRLDEWREVCDRLDPGHLISSDLDRRLGLRSERPGSARALRPRPPTEEAR